MALRSGPASSFLTRRRRASPVHTFSVQTPFSKPQQRVPQPPRPPVGPLKFQFDVGHPKPVSAPLSSPMQAGLSSIQSELGQRGPTAFNLPKLLNSSAHYLSHNPRGAVTRSQRFQLNPQSPYMLGATDLGQVVAPHEVSLYGNAPRRADHHWYEQWFEKGVCEQSPERCDKLKSLKRFYDRPYEKMLAGIPLPRLAEKNEKQVIDTGERLRRFRQYYEGKYDIDEPSMSKADYRADVEKKLKQPGSGINIPTTEALLRKEYNLKMSRRAKKEDWPTGKMPIDPGFYAHTEANREAIYDHAPKDKSYGDYWDEQHQNKHWWDYLSYVNPLDQGYKAVKAEENWASQSGDPAHDFYSKRKYLYEHPHWLKRHPEDKEKYMTGFLGNRLPPSWLGHLGTGIGDFALGLMGAASNPIGVGNSLINSVSTLPEHVKKECTAPGVDTESCVRTRQILQPLGLSSIGDVGWQSGTDLDAPIRSEPAINKALDIGGQSALAIAAAALPGWGGVGKAGIGAEAAGMGVERAAAEGVVEGAGSGLERAPLLRENTLPKTPLSEAPGPVPASASSYAKAASAPEQLAANESRMRNLATWQEGFSAEQNLSRQKALDRFMVDTDQLRKWQENPRYAEQQPSYFTHPRYEQPAYFETFDKELMNRQADTLLSDTPEGRAMRMNDRLSIIKNARKSPVERYNLRRGLTKPGELESLEQESIMRELMDYGKNIKAFRPEAELPKPPAYPQANRLFDKARWTARRALGKGPADGMPGKAALDEWLGPRFKANEALDDWLSDPKATKFYNKYRARLGGEPQAQKWSRAAQYPRVVAPQAMTLPELETVNPLSDWGVAMANERTAPTVPAIGRGVAPQNEKGAAFLKSAEDMTRHLERPEDSRLLSAPAARPKTAPAPAAAPPDRQPMSPKDYPELRHAGSSLIYGDAPQGSTLKSLEKMLSDEQRKIDTTHVINDASYSDAAKKKMMSQGKSDEFIRKAEGQRIVSAVEDYERRRLKTVQMMKTIQSAESGKTSVVFFRKKQAAPKLDTNAIIEQLRRYQGDAGRLLPADRIDSHLNLNVHTPPQMSRFAKTRMPIRKGRPKRP